jgi:ribosomal protein L11 methyltransferase
MIPPDALLSIYEIRGDIGTNIPPPPSSFIGLWNEEDVSYLFFTAPEHDYVERLVERLGFVLSSRHEIRYEDWQTGLPPQGLAVGGVRFAAAESTPPPPGVILLDPSVVFGDGTHPTTVCCLRFLAQIVHSRRVSSLLDLGTGSGILALAAAALGVRHILAVDRNHLAVQTAVRNVEANALSSVIRVREGEARAFMDRQFDVVAANLPFQVLRDLVTMDEASEHKCWIVSGISKDQGTTLGELLRERGHEIDRWQADPPWVTFTTFKRSPQ